MAAMNVPKVATMPSAMAAQRIQPFNCITVPGSAEAAVVTFTFKHKGRKALEAWRASTEADLKEIHDVVSQVKLLMSLSIGGGGLSILTLAVTLVQTISA